MTLFALNANNFLLARDVPCVYANIGMSVVAVLTLVRVLPSIDASRAVFASSGVVLWIASLLFWMLLARYGHIVSPQFEAPQGARLRARR